MRHVTDAVVYFWRAPTGSSSLRPLGSASLLLMPREGDFGDVWKYKNLCQLEFRASLARWVTPKHGEWFYASWPARRYFRDGLHRGMEGVCLQVSLLGLTFGHCPSLRI